MHSLKKGAMWHVNPLLGNDHEISKYTIAVTANKHVPMATTELQQ
jgi:hypothetical protein